MVPYCKDIIQEVEGKLETPEIRVWCHPHKIGNTGDDHYNTFSTFKEAEEFIETHKEAESVPLMAFGGYEINIYELTN